MTPAGRAERVGNLSAIAARLKLLGHPDRLLMLCRMDEGEASVTELVGLTGLSQSSVSQHLAQLRDQGAVAIRRAAQTRYYSLADPIVREIIHALCDLCGESCT